MKKVCKYFKKTDKGICKYYKGNEKESCNYNCEKINKIGTRPTSKIPMAVE